MTEVVVKKLPLVAAAAIAAGVAGAVLGMAPSGADPDDNNIANVTGEPYGKAVAILRAMGYKTVFGGAVGGDVPQSQCVVSSQKMIAGGSNNGAISSNGPTNSAKMQLMSASGSVRHRCQTPRWKKPMISATARPIDRMRSR